MQQMNYSDMVLDRNLKHTFGTIAPLYDRIRPGYPKEVVDAIISYSNISGDGRILDVCCGTGRSSELFVEKGYNVTCLDISKELIDIAKANIGKFSNVDFIVGAFEDYVIPENSFDLLISGTAFHWLDPDIAYKKVYTILKPGGTLALFWNVVEYKSEEWLKEISMLFSELCPHFTEKKKRSRKEFLDSIKFSNTVEYEYRHTVVYSKKDLEDLFRTKSWVISLSVDQREKLFEGIDKIIDKKESLHLPYRVDLLMGKK